MRGANGFTRFAGAAGLVGAALALLAGVAIVVMAARSSEPHPMDAGGAGALVVVLLVVLVASFLLLLAGLLVRHRGLWWVRPVLGLAMVSVVAAFGGDEAGRGIGDAALLLMAYGVVQAGELPRHGGLAVATSVVGDLLLDGPLGPVPALVGLYGYAVLSVAMWREPLAIERRREAWLAEAAAR